MSISKINVILIFRRPRALMHSETSIYTSIFYNAALCLYNTRWRCSLSYFSNCSTVVVLVIRFFGGECGDVRVVGFVGAYVCVFCFVFSRDFYSMGNFVLEENKMLAFFWMDREITYSDSSWIYKTGALQCFLTHLLPLIPTYVLHANPLGWRALFLSSSNHRHSLVLNKAPYFKGNVIKPPRRNKYQSCTR